MDYGPSPDLSVLMERCQIDTGWPLKAGLEISWRQARLIHHIGHGGPETWVYPMNGEGWLEAGCAVDPQLHALVRDAVLQRAPDDPMRRLIKWIPWADFESAANAARQNS
ncbi:hypothetical protein K7C98_03030 [Nannocystis pusilla]|uniref:Uncharacterized protein n=1 Tax=Nannocystis pusilla TaxID=889268 RepID=A0ABS7TJ27_9BACT|nr:hypothetical protein [Nannocystis pusilla]